MTWRSATCSHGRESRATAWSASRPRSIRESGRVRGALCPRPSARAELWTVRCSSRQAARSLRSELQDAEAFLERAENGRRPTLGVGDPSAATSGLARTAASRTTLLPEELKEIPAVVLDGEICAFVRPL